MRSEPLLFLHRAGVPLCLLPPFPPLQHLSDKKTNTQERNQRNQLRIFMCPWRPGRDLAQRDRLDAYMRGMCLCRARVAARVREVRRAEQRGLGRGKEGKGKTERRHDAYGRGVRRAGKGGVREKGAAKPGREGFRGLGAAASPLQATAVLCREPGNDSRLPCHIGCKGAVGLPRKGCSRVVSE